MALRVAALINMEIMRYPFLEACCGFRLAILLTTRI